MAVSTDSQTNQVPVSVTFNQHAMNRCANPALIELLQTANFTANFPEQTSSTGTTVAISTQSGNLIRADGSGAIYAAASTIITLQEQTVAFPITTGTGVPVTLSFGVPTLTSLNSAFLDLDIRIQPFGSLVRLQNRRFENSVLYLDFYRDLDAVPSPDFPSININVRGKILVVPAPAT